MIAELCICCLMIFAILPQARDVRPHFLPSRRSDITQIYNQLIRAPKKDEFETSTAYEQRLERFQERFRDEPCTFPIQLDKQEQMRIHAADRAMSTYDADSGELTVRLASSTQWTHRGVLLPVKVTTHSSQYRASNAFNRKVIVMRVQSEIYGIAVQLTEPDLQGYLKFSLQVPAQRARLLLPRLEAVLICRLDGTSGETEGFESSPTISSPVDISDKYFWVGATLDSILLIDKANDSVVARRDLQEANQRRQQQLKEWREESEQAAKRESAELSRDREIFKDIMAVTDRDRAEAQRTGTTSREEADMDVLAKKYGICL